MSIVETTLIFVGIPAAVFLLVAALVFGRAAAHTPRYRPGGSWQFEPVWYLPHPDHGGPALSKPPAALLDTAGSRALPGQVLETATASGGASGEW
ncbi:MAG: hypothetical protein QOE23_971 [Pseudonocardiales bacterium]|jgi:hypothetical protein|nr:hypothetical protein [Pseudonocardiales bacterium]